MYNSIEKRQKNTIRGNMKTTHKEHKQHGLNWSEWQDEVHYNVDASPSDYGYEYCDNCKRFIQVE